MGGVNRALKKNKALLGVGGESQTKDIALLANVAKNRWKIMQELGAKVWRVPPDGDCFFSAFRWLSKDERTVTELRAVAVEELLNTPQTLDECLYFNARAWEKRRERETGDASITKLVEGDNEFSLQAFAAVAEKRGVMIDQVFISLGGTDPHRPAPTNEAINTLRLALMQPAYYADEYLCSSLQKATGWSCLVILRVKNGNVITVQGAFPIIDPYGPIVVMLLDGAHFEPLTFTDVRSFDGVSQLKPIMLRSIGLNASQDRLKQLPMPEAALRLRDGELDRVSIDAPNLARLEGGLVKFTGGPAVPGSPFDLTVGSKDREWVINVSVSQEYIEYVLLSEDGLRLGVENRTWVLP
jgi:hypothetical protein